MHGARTDRETRNWQKISHLRQNGPPGRAARFSPFHAAVRVADSNAKGFIARAVNVLKNFLGTQWSDTWVATDLPDNTVGIPRTQDGRFTALTGLKAYFSATPAHENAPLNVTAVNDAGEGQPCAAVQGVVG